MLVSASRIALALLCTAVFVPPAFAGKRRVGRTKPSVRPAPDVDLRGSRGTIDDHVHVRRGDNLGRLLAARGVGKSEAAPWLAAAARVFDLRQIHPRRGVTLRFDRATRALEAVRYEIDDHVSLVLEKAADGAVRAVRTGLPYFTEVKGIATSIARGLKEDAAEAAVPPRIVSQLADIFGWDMDVESDLHPGDEVRVLYENLWQTGAARAEAGNVLGAEVVSRGRIITAVFFEDADGHGGYYRPDGEPLSRQLLRYPLEFTEITSEFSLLRRHPVLRIARPHLGVDFAAPVGTPVRAVATGRVTFAGWMPGIGRCVKIDHANALASTYGHLARLASAIAPGTTVERGQVIGYVGATGLATGPHLHFAIHRDGEYVAPLSVTAAAEPPIADGDRRSFERVQQNVTRELASVPKSTSPLTVSFSDLDTRSDLRPE